uniref:S-methyl thiohydantoin desulfurase domain-containing protein n=1 Tax=Bifidobacterium adolescentis TaxID=1680 RepID=UPI003FF00098
MGLIEAKICDVTRETRGGFNFGRAQLDGIRGSRGHTGAIEFQNENLIAYLDGEPVATTPDLICLVDCDTFIRVRPRLHPVRADSLRTRVTCHAGRCWPGLQRRTCQ